MDRAKVIAEIMAEELQEVLWAECFPFRTLKTTQTKPSTGKTIEAVTIFTKDEFAELRVFADGKATKAVLDDKFRDALEQLMVPPERDFIKAIEGAFAPKSGTFIDVVDKHAIDGGTLLLSGSAWEEVTRFHTAALNSRWRPSDRPEEVLNGALGTIQGMRLVTDGFRFATLQTLQPASFYALDTPEALGEVYCGPVSVVLDETATGFAFKFAIDFAFTVNNAAKTMSFSP